MEKIERLGAECLWRRNETFWVSSDEIDDAIDPPRHTKLKRGSKWYRAIVRYRNALSKEMKKQHEAKP